MLSELKVRLSSIKKHIIVRRSVRSMFGELKVWPDKNGLKPFLSICTVFSRVKTMYGCLFLGLFTCTHILMHAIVYGGCTDTVRVCIKNWLWEKKLFPHRGFKPAAVLSVALQKGALPTELSPPLMFMRLFIL